MDWDDFCLSELLSVVYSNPKEFSISNPALPIELEIIKNFWSMM